MPVLPRPRRQPAGVDRLSLDPWVLARRQGDRLAWFSWEGARDAPPPKPSPSARGRTSRWLARPTWLPARRQGYRLACLHGRGREVRPLPNPPGLREAARAVAPPSPTREPRRRGRTTRRGVRATRRPGRCRT